MQLIVASILVANYLVESIQRTVQQLQSSRSNTNLHATTLIAGTPEGKKQIYTTISCVKDFESNEAQLRVETFVGTKHLLLSVLILLKS